MKFRVTTATNFLRVFCLPKEFPTAYCFGGGHPVIFQNVDWFNAFPQEDFWDNKTKEFESTEEWYLEHVESLREFITKKKYFNPSKTYMILTDYGDVFIINPRLRANMLECQLEDIKKRMGVK
jgi:hypothetical protein